MTAPCPPLPSLETLDLPLPALDASALPGQASSHALGQMVSSLGGPGFALQVLQAMNALLPVASWSVYRTGQRSRPQLFLSASSEARDTTRECWRAYLSGPICATARGSTAAQRRHSARRCATSRPRR